MAPKRERHIHDHYEFTFDLHEECAYGVLGGSEKKKAPECRSEASVRVSVVISISDRRSKLEDHGPVL
jgi:hypothetical protein